MSALEGKTIKHVGDCGDTLYFTDGTSFNVTSDDGHYATVRDWAETQAALHEAQGDRERARMRRLHNGLCAQDKDSVAQQAREVYRRRYAEASDLGRLVMDLERSAFQDLRRDANRSLDYGMSIKMPKVRAR